MGSILVEGHYRVLNWKRQPTDVRDVSLHNRQALMKHLPVKGTTTTIARPAIRNQLGVGSCTNNSGAALMSFVWMKKLATTTDPLFSRLFGYYFTRKLEGTPASEDSGCNVRDVFKSYRRWGLCFEKTWPYVESQFSVEPTTEAQTEAKMHEALAFYACDTLHAIKQSITDGFPMIFGFDCFESLESEETARTGLIPLPERNERSIGGHSMTIDTYNDETREIEGQNSWSEKWGVNGRFRMSYDYFERKLASDATTLRDEMLPAHLEAAA